MNHPNYFRLYVLTTVAVSLMALGSCKQSEKKENEVVDSRPNIIYILADDLGYGDLSFTGQQKFNTPNIDRLAKEGMFFTQHYSGSTVCAPSRSALMTGQHTGHTFIRGNKEIKPEGQHPLETGAITVAELLKNAGYATGAYGKWGLGFPGSEGDPNNQGFDDFYGYNCQRVGHNYYPYHMWHNQNKEILDGNKKRETNTYGPHIIHEKALAFIEDNKDRNFFMYYPSIIPHAELAAPDDYMEKHRAKFVPETEYVGLDDGEFYKNGDYGSQKEPHTAFAAMISLLDDQVGEIRAKLESLGIADNTLIIFTSDNGPHQEGGADPDYFDSNSNFRGYKRDLYEGGIRVPMIAYWPGTIKPNTSSDHVSAFWDVLPTVCDIVQIDKPDAIDGISFLPELLGETQKEHNHLYWEFHEKGGRQAVRLGEWKGVRYNMAENPEAPVELYHLTTDEAETTNVAADHPDVVAQIVDIMKNEHRFSETFHFKHEKNPEE